MVLRIPANGRQGLRTTKYDGVTLTSQALTMRYINDKTNVPIPYMWFYDSTLLNEIKAPFILMENISGKSLGDRMVAWSTEGIFNEMMSSSLASIAKTMVELEKLQFDQIGMLRCKDNDPSNPPYPSHTILECAPGSGSSRVVHCDSETGRKFWIQNRIDSSKQYFRTLFEKSGFAQKSGWPLEYQRICEAIMTAVPKSKMSQDQKEETFGLVHRDLDAQNFLVDEDDGSVVAILDW